MVLVAAVVVLIQILLLNESTAKEEPITTADDQAVSIGVLASQLHCKQCGKRPTSSILSIDNDRSPPTITSPPLPTPPPPQNKKKKFAHASCRSDAECEHKLVCIQGSCANPLRRKKVKKEVLHVRMDDECDGNARATCFDDCYPMKSTPEDRKHLLYCSYCCLDCTCDPNEEANPERTVPAEVLTVLNINVKKVLNNSSLRRL